MIRKTKGTIEAEVANAIVRFHRDQQGRGPSDVLAHLSGFMISVLSSGIFTQTETHLAASEGGRRLIKSARIELRTINKAEIEEIVAGIVGCRVLRSYYDIDVDAEEQLEAYIFERDIEKRLER